jgi:hypothetical protein
MAHIRRTTTRTYEDGRTETVTEEIVETRVADPSPEPRYTEGDLWHFWASNSWPDRCKGCSQGMAGNGLAGNGLCGQCLCS